MRAAQRYPETTVFAVPLGDLTFGLGLVARRAPRAAQIFGYFFGPRLDAIPTLAQIPPLSPAKAVLRCNFGDLGLLDGSWPVIGKLQGGKREEWPMPLFYRDEYELLPRPDSNATRLFLIKRSDDNPAKTLWECRVETIPRDAEKDYLAGAGAVELRLRKLLDCADDRVRNLN